jgi:hypothetical protein
VSNAGRQFAILIILAIASRISSQTFAQSWPPVPDIDLRTFNPADFKDDELDLPYYLKHFHTVANSVVETGPDKGFINIAVWRNKDGNKTFNARIMENILSLAYFYCTKRPWNIYYGHPAVRLRLEASLDFWCRIQHTDGRFSEYGPGLWNLPATAFATKFMGETLILLQTGPPVDKQLLRRVTEADRKAIMMVLTNDSLYAAGKNFSNQFTNVYAGTLAYMSIYNDSFMGSQLKVRLIQSGMDFQSPAGFFYEAGGVDFGYNFNTHHSNLWMAYHFSRNTELANYFIEEEKRYYEWIKYNAVPEPSGYYTINRAIEMRQKTATVNSYFIYTPLSEAVEGIRAFNVSREEKIQDINKARETLRKQWPNVLPLTLGEFSAFSPYAFLHRRHYTWNPSASQKKEAINKLPYLANTRFIHQKVDIRNPLVFTYIRQAGYYAAFNSGPILRPQQRFGLGLLWHPQAGTFLQSQTDSDIAAWGTKGAKKNVYEADSIDVHFKLNQSPLTPSAGNHDFLPGILSISYPLKSNGKKALTFLDEKIEVNIQHNGMFAEHIPLLLLPDDRISVTSPGRVTLQKKTAAIAVLFDSKAKASLVETNLQSGEQRVVVLVLEAAENLNYSIIATKASSKQ